MSDTPTPLVQPYVLAFAGLRSVEVIDGGDTVAVTLQAAGGDSVSLLLPLAVVSDLLSQLASALDTVSAIQTGRPRAEAAMCRQRLRNGSVGWQPG